MVLASLKNQGKVDLTDLPMGDPSPAVIKQLDTLKDEKASMAGELNLVQSELKFKGETMAALEAKLSDR